MEKVIADKCSLAALTACYRIVLGIYRYFKNDEVVQD